jgi:hypothetical protein
MITYDKIKNKEKLVISLTGLTPSEFGMLLPFFEEAENILISRKIEETERERVCGGGRKSALGKISDKLLFILFYFKLYPLQILLGFLFGMGQSQANEWIHRLTEVLRITLSLMECLPERNPHVLEKTLTEDGETEFVIDGAEREISRPVNSQKQKQYYSGKKKRHTAENNVIVSVGGRKAGYPGGTCEGKKHDKKICDEENPVFPKGITLLKDTGFRGYEPEGADTRQPKKKPRGGELSVGEKVENSIISGGRIVAEHVISGAERCRIAEEKFRNTKNNFDDIVMEIACGLHNLRTDCRQTQN